MLMQMLKDIWNNKISKYLLITALAMIMIGLILSNKIPIYNFYSRLFSGKIYFDPNTYGNREYGYQENPAKARKLFGKGLKALVKLASHAYHIDYENPILPGELKHDRPWNSQVSENALKLVSLLFHDMELFCIPFDTQDHQRFYSSEKLNQRNYVQRDSEMESLVFAIKDDEFNTYANTLLEIDQSFFYMGLQKKPDSIPLLKIRENLLRAVCKPQNIGLQMTRAIQYKEYKIEKEVYRKYKGNDQEFIANETYNLLKKDKDYETLLKEQFQNTYFVTRSISERMKQSYNYYILKHDDYYLENYLTSILEYSAISGLKENEIIYNKALSLYHDQNTGNKSLLYTLAEISFRLHKFAETKEYLDKLSLLPKTSGSDYYKVKRLYFLLELNNEG